MTDLADIVRDTAHRTPGAAAVRAPDGEWTYGELDRCADRLAAELVARGVARGGRVAVWMPKSAAAVAAMQAILRIGAAYVPIDPLSPRARVRELLFDSGAAACVSLRGWAGDSRRAELPDLPILCADDPEPTHPDDLGASASSAPGRPPNETNDLAYILYTSGSTGKPKGVCISHGNALAFIEWAHRQLQPTEADRFASHAPFHFDLSVLDLYVAFASGATVCLIPEDSAYVAPKLIDFVRREGLTIWYSVPSALILMMEDGGLDELGASSLRIVLFAGEPFPIKHLKLLRRALPEARMLNLYGPTETNVCTFYELGAVPDTRTVPVPIGSACSGDAVWAEKADGSEAQVGEEGELVVAGPTVMLGYWGGPPQRGPYRTGDIVRRASGDCYEYLGRRDGMVKVRGNRVELGEIDSALLAHEGVREAATVVVGTGVGARLVAFVRFEGEPPGLLEMKRHCAERLPRHMIIAELRVVDELPRTRNGKIDRRSLAAECTEVAAA